MAFLGWKAPKKHPDQAAFESMGEVWAESDARLLRRIAALEQERDKLRTALADAFKAGTEANREVTAALVEALQKIADDPFLNPEANAAFARAALNRGETP